MSKYDDRSIPTTSQVDDWRDLAERATIELDPHESAELIR